MNTWPTKDPDDVLDYQFDWTARMATNETVVASVFTVVEGTVVKGVVGFTPQGVTTVWLSGGTPGETCLINNHIATSQGREYDETARLRVRSK